MGRFPFHAAQSGFGENLYRRMRKELDIVPDIPLDPRKNAAQQNRHSRSRANNSLLS